MEEKKALRRHIKSLKGSMNKSDPFKRHIRYYVIIL